MPFTSHLIGLCGAGMSAVAHLLQERGDRVTGSDEGAYPPISDYLEKVGLECQIGYRPGNLPASPDLIVIGKHAALTPEENAEVAAAFAQHRDVIRSFPEVLRSLTEGRERVVVAGSYGKSTLTSLITFCLVHAGKDPGWFIGAIPKDLEHSSALGGSGPFVFEGDEYPSANWDERAKFLHYAPRTVVLTSATHDHVNIYPTLEDYHRPFRALLDDLSARGGTLVACIDEAHARGLLDGFKGEKVAYGLEGNPAVTARNIALGDPDTGRPTTFDLVIDGQVAASCETHQLGRHSVQNICGAAGYLGKGGHLTADEFARAVAAFSGLARRLDRKAEASALTIYEGFGSSYEKARAAIDAVRGAFPNKRLVVVFEPHTFTWRNRKALDQYRDAFDGAGQVFLYSPPSHGAGSHDQASHDEILAAAGKGTAPVRPFVSGEMTALLDPLDPDRDAVLILSSGSFGGQLADFLTEAEARFPRG